MVSHGAITLALAFAMVAGVGCDGPSPVPRAPEASPATSEHRPEQPRPEPPPPPEPPRSAPLTVRTQAVGDRDYLLLHAQHLGVAVTRPDDSVWLSVAGTYTDPDDEVLGIVIVDGTIVQRSRMAWEAVLLIEGGIPRIERATDALLGEPALRALARAKGSMLQGHLLVEGGVARPLKPSPAVHRRAVITRADGSFAIVDSHDPVSLGTFAQDLIELGGRQAMNLDMGSWSEGFYRDPRTAARHSLGHDTRSTARQSNWLFVPPAEGVVVERGR